MQEDRGSSPASEAARAANKAAAEMLARKQAMDGQRSRNAMPVIIAVLLVFVGVAALSNRADKSPMQDEAATASKAESDRRLSPEYAREVLAKSVASAKDNAASQKGKYLEQLDREIASLEKDEAPKASDISGKQGVMMQTVLIGAWAKVYSEGKGMNLAGADAVKLARFKALLSKAQERRFPALRQAQVAVFKEALWENDIDVASAGRGLRLTGGIFAANKNIATAFKSVRETAELLRFNRVTFEWYRGSENTYYDLKPLPDGEVAELTPYGWSKI